MRIDRGEVLFGLLAVVLAALFVRLGLWQVDRLEEKRSLNALRAERLDRPPVRIPPEGLAAEADAGSAGSGDGSAGGAPPSVETRHEEGEGGSGIRAPLPPYLEPADGLPWRRAELVGRYDFRHEVVLRGRLRDGRPGVELLTPLRPAGSPAVFVHRGWLPAADGLHAPLDSARTGAVTGRVLVRGIVVPGALEADADGAEASGNGGFRVRIADRDHLVLTRLDVRRAAGSVPYPVLPFYVRATEPATEGPLFRDLPPLAFDEGPHLGYAIQWFAFAVIAVVGAGIYLARS